MGVCSSWVLLVCEEAARMRVKGSKDKIGQDLDSTWQLHSSCPFLCFCADSEASTESSHFEALRGLLEQRVAQLAGARDCAGGSARARVDGGAGGVGELGAKSSGGEESDDGDSLSFLAAHSISLARARARKAASQAQSAAEHLELPIDVPKRIRTARA
eukprot:GHVT01059178.1.p1 GENE.GHVT01059178.1~~GHVT01059178.1.p1  ORF type:complete len:159 (-),score=23.49 GHVT01059178.1:395-871(-)